MDSKIINEFESILNELATKVDPTLSINDVAHAFFLMKAFVVYPKNYGGLIFENTKSEIHLR